MTVRTTSNSVTFKNPFQLPGFDAPLPAGTFMVDTDEEVIESGARMAYRRVATTLIVETLGRVEHRTIQPQDLEAALNRDRLGSIKPAEKQVSEIPLQPDPSPIKLRRVRRWARSIWTTKDG